MAEYKGLKAILKRFCDLIEPVGTVKMSASTIEPTWHLYCFGDRVKKVDYPDLWNAIGHAFALPTDTDAMKVDYFRLPDLRECVAVGAGINSVTPSRTYKNTTRVFDSTEVNPGTGTNGTQAHDAYLLGTFKDDQFQGHEHSYKNFEMRYGDDKETSAANEVEVVGALSTTAIVNKSGYGNVRYGTTTHSKQVGLYYIIKF